MDQLKPDEESWADAIARLFRCDCQPTDSSTNFAQSVQLVSDKIDFEPVKPTLEQSSHEALSKNEFPHTLSNMKDCFNAVDINPAEASISDKGQANAAQEMPNAEQEMHAEPEAEAMHLQTTEPQARSRMACCGLFKSRSARQIS